MSDQENRPTTEEEIRASWDLDFVVQPVSYTGVGQRIAPVVVRILPPNQNGETVYAHCSLVTLDGLPVEAAVIPGTTTYQEALESERGTLMCHASEPTYSNPILIDPVLRDNPKKRSGGGSSSGSSSSASNNRAVWTSPNGVSYCADGGDVHVYFAFSGLKIAWPGTYALHVEVYRFSDYTEAVARVISGPIQVLEGSVPVHKLNKAVQRRLFRIQDHENMYNLQVDSNDFAEFM
ncbi:hypothetical protein MAPG_09259 [Magnaporthiopsis poae ATCC 64411]|uniref:Velvet domain-containing protein n=1 Tax=Magnaporthiopsis poae (strain ATCC 64411 / 73-15) TaxID=644358 RepID=A0A0C4E9H4_MAGP6|nr:hypothetical protein MAPG_09259 [Magnaporthiopsis poae ATCC 64411]